MSNETMVCPECGWEINSTQSMCPNCGFPIHPVMNQSETESITKDLGIDMCPECGHEINTSQRICPNCGFPIAQEIKQQMVSNSGKNTCPECGAEINGNSKMCPSCGFPLNTSFEQNGLEQKCPECGSIVRSTDTKCSNCGFPLSVAQDKKQIQMSVLIAPLLVALIFIVLGIKQLNDPMIDFYIGHIEECKAGIADAEWDKKDTLITLKSDYDYIIRTYEDLIKDDTKKMRSIQMKGYVLLGIGVVIILAIPLYATKAKQIIKKKL